MTTTTASPTAQLVAAASTARDHWMRQAHRAEGTPEEKEADRAFIEADKAYKAACKAHRAARRAHGDNV